MKRYIYEFRDSSSHRLIKATVRAESENAAAKLLTSQGIAPLKIELQDENSGLWSRFSNRITTKDKILFTRQLATLIGAGLPLTQSLHTILDQITNPKMQEVVRDVVSDVEGGKALSAAFAKHPEVFDKVYIALVSAGEASGTMDDALKRLAAQQEKDAAMVSRVRGAMTYPLIVLAVILIVVAFMLLRVVPQVEQLYDDLNKELPLPTQVLVGSANFVIQFWWVIVVILAVGGYFFFQYIKTEPGIRSKDNFKLNAPLFKGLFRKLYMARFSRTGQTLLSTGVPMIDMLNITSHAVNNVVVGEEIDRAAEKVKGGKALSVALKNEEYFLAMVPQMIKIGEQSGKIDEMLGKTAQIYENELDDEIRAISTAIEPILMVVLALMAALMVGAILFPIYSLVNDIRI